MVFKLVAEVINAKVQTVCGENFHSCMLWLFVKKFCNSVAFVLIYGWRNNIINLLAMLFMGKFWNGVALLLIYGWRKDNWQYLWRFSTANDLH